jgi:glycine/D-amino acid oxidase-like deaminating enzyme
VIGAGIAGFSVACAAAREGRSVVVIDDGPVGGGETGRSTAHPMTAFDDRYAEVQRIHGAAVAHRVAESHAVAIDSIEAILHDEGIDCGFARVDGYLFAPAGAAAALLEREQLAARRLGLAARWSGSIACRCRKWTWGRRCGFPARRRLRAVGEFLRENLDVARSDAGWGHPGEVRQPARGASRPAA